MTDGSLTILTAGLATIVTVVGWNVSHYLAKRREDRTRRIESSINRLERQIEEFYGPMLSLIEQIFNVWRVRRILFDNVSHESKERVDEFVWNEYFLPLHMEIRDLLKTKYYLADDSDVTSSIKEYLEHSTQELFQTRISRELKISTAHVEGKRWPRNFYPSVEKAIQNIRGERERLMKDIQVSTNK